MFIVLFDVCPHAAQLHLYLDFAQLLRPELERMPGFIDNERFTNVQHPTQILSLSTWTDEKALIRWRTRAQHHHVQEQGRALVFADYRLRVGEIIADSAAPNGDAGPQQRFDTTEASSVTHISVLALDPSTAGSALAAQVVRAATIFPAQAPAGWIEGAHFTSITHPGKQVLVLGWRAAEAAHAWHAAHIAPFHHVGLRSRCVRVIRAYGMADRGEAPQYYPDVAAAACW